MPGQPREGRLVGWRKEDTLRCMVSGADGKVKRFELSFCAVLASLRA